MLECQVDPLMPIAIAVGVSGFLLGLCLLVNSPRDVERGADAKKRASEKA